MKESILNLSCPKQIDSSCNLIVDIIKETLELSDSVYVFRAYEHLKEVNDFVSWVRENSSETLKAIEFKIESIKYSKRIEAKCDELIYRIDLDEDNRINFLNHMKLSIRDVKYSSEYNFKMFESHLFVDNPLYDQYNMIFSVGEEIYLFVDAHPFIFLIDSEKLKY